MESTPIIKSKVSTMCILDLVGMGCQEIESMTGLKGLLDNIA